MRTFTGTPRAIRIAQQREQVSRIRGYGLAIDTLDGYPHDARLLDHSPALFPEKIASTEGEKGDRRRFGFVEYWGDGSPPKTGLLRHVGDVFFADRRTAEFVWQAVIEKIERQAVGL